MTQGHQVEDKATFEICDLTVSLGGGAVVLDGLSHTIVAGKINALIGPSGCGKSTLLRCLNKLIEPTKGSIRLDGVDITDIDVLTLRARVGMVMQSATMFAGSIAENLAFGPSSLGQEIDRPRMKELLELVSLDPSLLDKDAQKLSGGQAQRVSIARSLANKPEVLLLDEPTSALDPAATRTIEATLIRLRDELGMTIVLVSHSMEQVERIADTSALMLDGKIIETGTPEHILTGVHHHWTEQFAKGKLSSQKENQPN